MGTLSSCLKKIGLSAHESAILRGATDENIKDGDEAHIAAVRAVSDYIEQLEKDRAHVAGQVVSKNGRMPNAPFKLAELSVLTKALSKNPALETSGIHIEAGEIEKVTPAVVADSLKKSAQNTAFNPKEALAWLTKEIKAALKAAPKAEEKGVWDRVNQKIKLEGVMNVEEAIGFKVFDVPGDGKFKVLNLKESLEKFLSNVEKNPGFKQPRNHKEQTVAPWQKTSGSASESEVREMLTDGDYTAAFEFSKQIGKPLVFGYGAKSKTGGAIPYTDTRPFEVEGYEDFNMVVGRVWDRQDNGDIAGRWHVIELSTGLSIGNASSKKAVEAQVRGSLVGKNMTPEKMAEVVANAIKKGDGKPQSELEAAWLAWAEEKEGGNSLLSDKKEEPTATADKADKTEQNPEARLDATGKRTDNGWHGAGIGAGGRRQMKRQIELPDGTDIEATLTEHAGRYDNGYVYVNGKEVFRTDDSFDAQGKIDKFIEGRYLSQQHDVGTAPLVDPTNKALDEAHASTKQVKDENGNTATEVTLPSGRVVQIQRLNSTESMGLPGWHGPDGYLADTKDGAVKELVAKDFKSNKSDYKPADGDRRAVSGGQEGVNGYFYKGGQFLPTTQAEPGKWRVGKKWIRSGNELVAPGEYALQPTPFSRSIFEMVRGWTTQVGDKLVLRENVRDVDGSPITSGTTMTPGVRGVLGKEKITFGELIDAWNNGQRWFDVNPDVKIDEVQKDSSSENAENNQKQEANGGKEYPLDDFDNWWGERTYASNGGKLVYMSPDQYISIVKPLTLDDESRENIDLLKEHIESGKKLDPLLIYANGKEDGRHRAYAAKELGIKQVPVIVFGEYANRDYSGNEENKPNPLTQTFEQWLDAEYESSEYKEAYLNRAGGDLQKAKYQVASRGDNSEKAARLAYNKAILSHPRDADLSLDVFDSLNPDMQREASRHFFSIDKKWSDREQHRASEAYKKEQGEIAPIQEKLDEVNAELKKRSNKPTTDVERNLLKKQAKLENEISDIKSGKKSADAGEELTYNKRNRRKTGLTWDEIADKNDALKAKEVIKAKVYPKPDYQAMIDGGMKPVIAHLVKQMYDSIAAKPALGRNELLSEASMKAYIEGVNRVMDGVMKWANDKDAIASWAGRNVRMMSQSFSVMDTFSKNDTPLNFVYPNGWKERSAEVNYLGGNKFYGALQPGSEEVRRANKDLKLGWPEKAEAWQKQGYRIVHATPLKAIIRAIERAGRDPFVHAYIVKDEGKGTGPTITAIKVDGTNDINDQSVQLAVQAAIDQFNGKYVLQNKSGTTVESFGSMEEAEEGARNATKRESDEGKIKEIGRKVSETERVGVERRMEDKDVSAQDLIDTFGFRGVNFGNSMQGDSKSLINERQLHLNHIYDAFYDLAELLNIPPKAMSLNGMLGIAVGAQGSGKALAHFVPGVNEINITRRAGAGALAHEWGHAFDHYFATLGGLSTRERPYLTAFVSGPQKETVRVDGKWVTRDVSLDGVRPEIVDQFRSIVSAMQKRPESPEERIERLENGKAAAFEKLQSWLNFYRREVKKSGGDKADAALAKIEDIERKAEKLDVGDGVIAISKKYAVAPLVSELGKLVEETTGAKADPEYLHNTHYYIERMKHLDDALKSTEQHTPAIVDTSYYRTSKSADSKKKEYWSTPLEMFARAFDAYVVDSLAEKEAKNEYLGGMEAVAPQGEERKAINKAFDFLIAELKTNETDRGVAIYNQTDEVIPESEWLPTGQITDHINGLLDQFASDIPVTIIDNERDVLPTNAAWDDQIKASGMLYKGRIYLIRSGLDSLDSVTSTLFHEMLHYGIRRFVPEGEYIAQMKALYKSDPWIQAKAEEWLNTVEGLQYAKKNGDEAAAARAVDESLAKLAEMLHEERTGPGVTVRSKLDAVVESVMKWLKNLADKFKFGPVKTLLDDMAPGQETRDYVESIFKKLREGDNPPFNMTQTWAYSDPAFNKASVFNEFTIQEQEGGPNKPVLVNGAQDIVQVPIEVQIRTNGRFLAKPVRLLNGKQFGNSSGYGLAHITHGHEQDARKHGVSVAKWVVGVIRSANRILDDGSGRLVLSSTQIPRGQAYVELRDDGDFYSVVTAYNGLERGKLVWSGRRLALSSMGSGDTVDAVTTTAEQSGSSSAETAQLRTSQKQPLETLADQTNETIVAQKTLGQNTLTLKKKSQFSLKATHSGAAPSDIRNALIERFGKDGITALESSGLLKVMRLKDAPQHILDSATEENASALYDPTTGIAYLFSDRMTPDEAAGKLLHEIGEHYGLEKMLGADGWGRMKKRIANMAKGRGSIAYGAWQGVKANYSEFANLSDDELANNDRFLHEVLAAIGENKAGLATSLWREILAAVKEWLASKGLLVDWMNEGDIANLVSGSLKRVMKDAQRGSLVVDDTTMENVATDYFRQIVTAMKMAKQLIEDCA